MNNLFTLHFSLYYPIYKQFIGEGCSLHPSFHGKRLRDCKRLRDSILSAFFHSYIFAMYKNEALWI